jgi:beta-galactosidase
LAAASAFAQPDGPATVWRALRTDAARSVTQGWLATKNDAGITGRPLSIGGQRFERGLGTHAPGEIVYDLGGRHTRFVADVGLDDNGGPAGSVVFRVLLDGRVAFDSGLMRTGEPAKHVALDVSGVSELRLAVADGGNGVQHDHADWANAAVDDVVVPKPVPAFSAAGFFAVSNAPRRVLNFNPGWRFLKADAAGAEREEFDDASWEAAALPHGLEILGVNESGGRNHQGPAWYRKRFTVPGGAGVPARDERVTLYFEAVMGKCIVWVNSRKVAEHFGGYLPFAADVTAVLHADGRPNVVAVRADNSDDSSYPPGKPQGDLDFTYLGGIYRDVFLIVTDALHVTLPELSPAAAGGGVFVGVKAASGESAELEVRTEIANETDAARRVTLRTTLETADGRAVARAEQAADLPPGGRQRLAQTLEANPVRLWHPDDPCLHFVRTEVLEAGRTRDALLTRVGLRLFEMRGRDGLHVNGKPLGKKLNGVNRHQDYAFVGNALPNSGQWRDVKLLREGGVNFVRAAHYPQDPAFYDACDALGMLVTTASPGWQFYNGDDPAFERRVYEDVRALVRRDRNRPSMLLWETALNETPHQPERVLGEMHRVAHDEYPFPGLFTVADVDEAKKGGFDVYYHGSLNEPKNSLTREYGDGGEVDNFYSQNATARVKRGWGEGPLLMQAAIRARGLDDLYATPLQRLGAALWCGIDHQRGYHPDPFWGGLLDSVRLPRYAYDLFRSQYDPDFRLAGIETGPMVAIAHEVTQVSGPDVTVYSNCEEVRLTWLGQAAATRRPDEDYRHLPHPPFTFVRAFDFGAIKREWRDRTAQIEMVAEGLIGGKVAARAVKRYPERTAALSVIVDDAGVGLAADGSDVVPVRAVVVDNKGVPKVLASEEVFFEVEGPAEIVDGPLARANPARTEFGTATVLLRAAAAPGVIRVTARAPGLRAGEAHLASAPPAVPLCFDGAYAAGSKRPRADGPVVLRAADRALPADVDRLREQVLRLQRELIGKEQELMELRSRVK